MSVKENVMKDIKGEFMNPVNENKAKDSPVPNTVNIKVGHSFYNDPEELIINCDKIVIKKDEGEGRGITVTLDGNMDYTTIKKIIINGVTYERVRERDDRDDPFLQYFGL